MEVLGQAGLVSITDRIFPDPGSRGVSVYARGGTAKAAMLMGWKLNSVWR